MRSIRKVQEHLLSLCMVMLIIEGCTEAAYIGNADQGGDAGQGGDADQGGDSDQWKALELTMSQYQGTVYTPISYSAELIGDGALRRDVEITLSSDIEPELSYTSDSLTPKRSGIHTITATASFKGTTFTDEVKLEMLGREPVEIELRLSTETPNLNQRVIAEAIIRDEFGNELDSSWSLAIVPEPPAKPDTVTINGHELRFKAEGLFTVEAIVDENGISDRVGPIVIDSLPPRITVDNPERFSMTEASSATITGSAIDNVSQITSVTVNGDQMELQRDETKQGREVRFATDVNFEFGTNLIKTIATDDFGRKGTDYRAIISGPHVPRGKGIATGIQTRISSNSLKSIAGFAEKKARDLNVSQMMEQANPLVNIDKKVCIPLIGCHTARAFRFEVHNLRRSAIGIQLQTRNDGKLTATSTIHNIVVDWNAHVVVWPLPFDFSGQIKANSITIRADIKPKVQNGRIDVDASNVSVSSSGFDLDWSGIMKVVDFFDFGILDNLAKRTVEDSLRSTVVNTVPTALRDALQDLSLASELDIKGTKYTFEARPEAVTVDDAGITLSLGTFFRPAEWRNISDLLPGSLYGRYTIPRKEGTSKGLNISLSVDFMSQMLYGLWGGGLLDQEIDASSLGVYASLLSGIIPGIDKLKTIVVKSRMPPVALPSSDENALLDIQLGDVEVALYGGDSSDPKNLILRLFYGLEAAVDMTVSDEMKLLPKILETTYWIDIAEPIFPNDLEIKIETLLLSVSGVLESLLQDALTEIPLPEIGGLKMNSPEIGMTGHQGGYINVSGDLAGL